MSRSGIPAFDAGEALAQGRPAVLRRALDRLIEPRSALVVAGAPVPAPVAGRGDA